MNRNDGLVTGEYDAYALAAGTFVARTPVAVPSNDNFAGYFTSPSGGTMVFNASGQPVTDQIGDESTLYAQWGELYVNAVWAVQGSGSGPAWRFDDQRVLHLTEPDTYVISGQNSLNECRIVVEAAATVILDNASVRAAYGSALSVDCPIGQTVTLQLKGNSSLSTSADGQAAVRCREGTTLVIERASNAASGSAALSVTGGAGGAGIGTDRGGTGGEIRVKGGVISALGGNGAAGIGAGAGGRSPRIVFEGGTVAAEGLNCCGIGQSVEGSGGEVVMTGGSIWAAGGIKPPMTNGSVPVYPVTVPVSVADGTVVDVAIENRTYGATDIVVRGGKICLYLPYGGYRLAVNGIPYWASVASGPATAVQESQAHVSNWADLRNCLTAGIDVALATDVTADETACALAGLTDRTLTLDLNGHSLRLAKRDGSQFTIDAASNLNFLVKDTSYPQTGRILGPDETSSADGVFMRFEGSGRLMFDHVAFAGLNTTAGGAVALVKQGDLEVKGGHFSKSSAGGSGGIFRLVKAQATLSGATFEGCAAGGNGGVCAAENANLTVSDCRIMCCRADFFGGAVFSSATGKTLDVSNTTVESCTANCGGAFDVESDVRATFSGVTVDGCTAQSYGGALQNSGITSLSDVTLRNCRAQYGGALACRGGEVTFASGEIYGNCSQDGGTGGGIVLRGGDFVMNGGTIRDNAAEEGASVGAVSVWADADFSMYGGVIRGNSATDGTAAVCVGDPVSASAALIGGLIDDTSVTNAANGVAVGDETCLCRVATFEGAYGEMGVVVWSTEPFALDASKRIVRGTLTVDPQAEAYEPYGLLAANVQVMGGGNVWHVSLAPGASCQATTVNGVVLTVREQDGRVVVGDGTNPAVGAGIRNVAIDATLAGYEVAGIAANAFAGREDIEVIVFLGEPSATVGENAFPANARGLYLPGTEAEWEAALTDGAWHGLRMDPLTPCADWATFKAIVESGNGVLLTADIVQDAGSTIVVPSGEVTVDFFGHKVLKAPNDAAPLFRLTGGSLRLTGGGTISGTDTAVTLGMSLAAVEADASYLWLENGEISGVYADSLVSLTAGSFWMTGGTIRDCKLAYGLVRRTGTAQVGQTGGWIVNVDAPQLFGTGESVHVVGGISDRQPDAVAAGYEAVTFGTRQIVARAGSVVRNEDGKVVFGIFTFDPTVPEIALSSLSVLTSDTTTEPPTYAVAVPNGTVFTQTVNGVSCVFRTEGQTVMLGDGESAAVDVTLPSFVLPETVCGMPLAGLAPNAFAGCTELAYVRFPGGPLPAGAQGAFPATNVEGIYDIANREAWEAAVTDGRWCGIPVGHTACDRWASVCANLVAGADVRLVTDIVQAESSAAVTGSPRLDLSGWSLTANDAVGPLLSLQEGATLTVDDRSALGGGSVRGTSVVHIVGAEKSRLVLANGTFDALAASCATEVTGGIFADVKLDSAESSVRGGVFTTTPASLAAGTVVTAWKERQIVGLTSVSMDDDLRLMRGDLSFDVAAPGYGRIGLRLANNCQSVCREESGTWSVCAVGVFSANLGDEGICYRVTNGLAYLGDGTNAAFTNPAAAFVSLPAKLHGYELRGIAPNAFKGLAGFSLVDFQGPPPTVEEGSFLGPTNLVVGYSGDYADAWLAEIDAQGRWHGLVTLRMSDCRTWAGLVRNLADGCPASLACDIRQESELVIGASQTNAVLNVNDFTLRLGRRLRLATVKAGGVLTLDGMDGLVLGDAEPPGASVQTEDDVAAAAYVPTGGCVYVEASGTFRLSGGTITNAIALQTGGAVYVAPGGRFEMKRGTLANCLSMNGGGVSCDGEAIISGGTVRWCGSMYGGGAIFVGAGGRVDVRDGVFATNWAWGGDGDIACNAGGRLTLYDGLYEGNGDGDDDGVPNGSLLSVRGGATNVVYGGVFVGNLFNSLSGTATYGGLWDEAVGRAPEGYELVTSDGKGGFFAPAGEVFVGEGQKVMKGAFTFDPTLSRYAERGLVLSPDCELASDPQATPPQYVASIVNGGPYAGVAEDGSTWTYRIVGGKAVLGDGEHPATSGTSARTLMIPAALDGYAVDGFAANAFAGFDRLSDLVFLGLPPSTINPSAFSVPLANLIGSCLFENIAAWEPVVAGGTYLELKMEIGRCFTWEQVKRTLEAGYDVTLVSDISQGDSAIELTQGARTLDLNGYELQGSPNARVAELNGGSLAISGNGTIVGPSGARSDDGGAFRVTVGRLDLDGVTIRGFRSTGNGGAVAVEADGELMVYSATFDGCAAEAAGGAVSVRGRTTVYDGTVTSCTAKDGGAFAVPSGTLNLAGGTVKGCTASGCGGAVCSSGTLLFVTGVLRGNTAATGGAIAVLAGEATLSGGLTTGNGLSAGGRASALYIGGGTVAVAGGRWTANGADETTFACDAAGTYKITGGVFDFPLGADVLEEDWASFAFRDALFVVAKEASLSWQKATGELTAGIFTFDPSDAALEGLLVFNPVSQVVTATGGNPATWTISYREVVPCGTWEDLQANLAVGNRTSSSFDFTPPSPKTIPQGFVYRGRVMNGKDPVARKKDLTVRLNLYAEMQGGSPVWTGEARNVETDGNGTFQLWIDDALATTEKAQPKLVDLFNAESGCYLGVAFNGGEECVPRRALVTSPIASRADTAARLDDVSTVGCFDGRDGTVVCETLNLENAICSTLEFTTASNAFNVALANLGGCTLYRHADNRILSRHASDWTNRRVEPGDVLVYNAAKSGLLTVQSTNDCSVPLLTFPVPTGATFIWRSEAFEGRYRFTAFGE